jgi:hypothetical protein
VSEIGRGPAEAVAEEFKQQERRSHSSTM